MNMNEGVSIDDYGIEKADLVADKEEIVSLWRQGESSFSPSERFEWYYLDPASPQKCLFAMRVSEGSSIIGTETVTYRDWFNGDKKYTIGIFGDFFIDQRFRSLGPALKLLRHSVECVQKNDYLVYGFPNRKAQPVFRRAGFKPANKLTRYAKVLKSREALEKHAKLGKYAWLSPLVDFALQLEDLLRLFSRLPYDVEFGKAAHPDTAKLVRKAVESNPELFIGDRSQGYLNWRFAHNPQCEFEFLSVSKGGVLQGYAVCSSDQEGNFAIEDFLVEDFDRHTQVVLSFVVGAIRKRGAKSLSFTCSSSGEFESSLQKLRFYPRETRPVFHVYGNSYKESDKQLYLTHADEDQ